MKTNRILTLGLAVALLLMTATALEAQRPGRGGRGRPAPGERPSREKKSAAKPADKAAAKKKGPVTAIVGGDVYTVSREVIRRGTVLVQDGKILDVGQQAKVPKGAKVIDAKGKYVTPGFVAINMTRIGLRTISTSSSAKPTDSLDPFDINIKRALGVGITTGCLQSGSSRRPRGRLPNERFLGLEPEFRDELPPGINLDFGDPNTSVCKCCGLPILPTEPITPTRSTRPTTVAYLALKMAYGDLTSMVLAPSPVYGMSSGSLTGAENKHKWRQTVAKARKYLKDQAAHEKAIKEKKTSRPPRKPVPDAVIKLVKRELYLRTDAGSVDQIRDMIALAKELDYRLMLDGVTEGWLVADELSEAQVPVVITPRRRISPRRGDEGRSGSSIEMSGILEKTGVSFAVTPLSNSISMMGLAGRDLTSLPLEAAFAVRGGCSERAALAGLTIVPAQMLGLADRIGSIDKGKDADLLIFTAPPLDYRSYVELAMVNGEVRYDRDKDRIYPVFDRK